MLQTCATTLGIRRCTDADEGPSYGSENVSAENEDLYIENHTSAHPSDLDAKIEDSPA